MDLHLDDAVAQGNSMLDQMKGEGMSSKSLQSGNLNHYEFLSELVTPDKQVRK